MTLITWQRQHPVGNKATGIRSLDRLFPDFLAPLHTLFIGFC